VHTLSAEPGRSSAIENADALKAKISFAPGVAIANAWTVVWEVSPDLEEQI
jgi:hypothetical protein